MEIDKGHRFKVHEEMVGTKATKTALALYRILPNVGGSSTAKINLLASAVHSQILYAAPIWTPLMEHRADGNMQIQGDSAKHIKSAQRLMALRATRAYRTVSYEAVTLIASMIQIKLLAKERSVVINATDKRQAAKDARKESITQWHAEKGRWTYELTNNVEKWTNRKHGDLDHFLTQVLTNHGCFNAYLWRMKKLDLPKCSQCEADEDDSNHTLFECDAFENWRRQLFGELGCQLTKENMIDNILKEKKTWRMVSSWIRRVREYECEAERRRQVA